MPSMWRSKKLSVALIGAAGAVLVVGLGAAGAVAASRAFSPDDERKAVIDDAAARLGVKPSELSDALEKALEARVDKAVADGRLTKEQGAELKTRIESGGSPFPLGLGGRGFGRGGFDHDRGAFGFHDRFDVFDTAASYLGLDESELRDALAQKTLADVAKERSKSVSGLVNALVGAEEKRIDEAVANGRITKSQGSEFQANLRDRIQALVNGDLPDRRLGPHPGFLPGFASPRAPPFGFRGPSA